MSIKYALLNHPRYAALNKDEWPNLKVTLPNHASDDLINSLF